MKSLFLTLTMAIAAVAFVPMEADAKRIGGGGASGMQRSMPSRAPDAAPARPATPTTPAAAPNTAGANPAAAAPKRSWMGPIAGLAAGLGIAALMSHFGLGAGMGNLLTMLLIAGLAFFAIRFLMRRFAGGAATGGMQYAGAGAGAGAGASSGAPITPMQPPARATEPAWSAAPNVTPLPMAASASALPSDFDKAGFERIAKMIFIRMQAANDTGDLNDLRTFTTPEMFAAVKMDLQDRHSAAQQTDVVRIDASVLDVATEADRQIVSVRFHGLIREEKDGVAAPFDEVWHLVKPADGSREWAIAGIQQTA